MRRCRPLPRAFFSAIAALMVLTGGALAQTTSGTISVTVLAPAYACAPIDSMTVQLFTERAAIEVQNGATTSDNASATRFRIDVINANCKQWSITAELNDFALSDDSTVTFTGSSLVLSKENRQEQDNPFKWLNQPQWVQDIPGDVATGMPTMPDTVSFVERDGGGSATSDRAVLTASTAAYGSPGSYSTYYSMTVTNLPPDLTPGTYTSTATISVLGND